MRTGTSLGCGFLLDLHCGLLALVVTPHLSDFSAAYPQLSGIDCSLLLESTLGNSRGFPQVSV